MDKLGPSTTLCTRGAGSRNRLGKRYASLLVRGHNHARLVRRLRKISFEQKFAAWTDNDDDVEEAFFSE